MGKKKGNKEKVNGIVSEAATGTTTPAEASGVITPAKTAGPTVIGINFGNSYASIAVLTKTGLAECIANEDGERQIACAVSFHGEELYIGNQAKPQLVKNASNTITGFRNLLGKKFSEIPHNKPLVSAPVIQHPEKSDVPAYRVEVLQPAPSPLAPSAATTPAPSHAPTPRSEPVAAQRMLSVHDVTVLFLRSLAQSARDFLGTPVDGAVIAVPGWFDESARKALTAAAEEADIKVLQLLDDTGAVAVSAATSEAKTDRTTVVVDVGASSADLTLLSVRDGLACVLGSVHDDSVGGDAIDDRLLKYFAKEFAKKTKTNLALSPAKQDAQDARGEARLRLALEHTKRTLSASPGAAACSVESLKDGLDFAGTINRMRFDLEARPVYTAIATQAQKVLSEAGIDPLFVDELVFVGGSASLPGLQDAVAAIISEDVAINNTEPTEIIACGSVSQASLLTNIPDEHANVRDAFLTDSEAPALGATISLVFPGVRSKESAIVPLLLAETALPARRTKEVGIKVKGDRKILVVELWETRNSVRVKKVPPPPRETEEGEGEEDEEPEEDEEVRYREIEKVRLLRTIELDHATAGKLVLDVTVQADGRLEGKATIGSSTQSFSL